MSQAMPCQGKQNVTPQARELFLKMLEDREQQGIKTYGTTLQTENGRDALRDTMEELVDAWQYLVQLKMEREANSAHKNFAAIRLKVQVDDSQLNAALAKAHIFTEKYCVTDFEDWQERCMATGNALLESRSLVRIEKACGNELRRQLDGARDELCNARSEAFTHKARITRLLEDLAKAQARIKALEVDNPPHGYDSAELTALRRQIAELQQVCDARVRERDEARKHAKALSVSLLKQSATYRQFVAKLHSIRDIAGSIDVMEEMADEKRPIL